MTGFSALGVEHSWLDLGIFTVGWLLGWFLLWRPRQLPPASGDAGAGTGADDRRPVAVVIPARDEAASLPHLLRPLVAQRRDGDEIVVVDDHSQDGTARTARAFDVEVVTAPDLPDGWLGKPHACRHGADSTSAPTLIFLDADVRPGPSLLDDLASEVTRHPRAVVSVQPWHLMRTVGEQPSALCNVAALMGCGAFTPFGDRSAATVAFGPVIGIDRTTYDASGGHGAESVRTMHTEDIALARAVGSSRLFVGGPTATVFRMYPGGVRALVRGWGRSIATGARFTPWWIALATAAWMASLAGGWIAAPLVYPLSAVQVWVLGRRAGSIHPVSAALFPVLVASFVVVFLRSAIAVVLRRDVNWKGRRVGTRPD